MSRCTVKRETSVSCAILNFVFLCMQTTLGNQSNLVTPALKVAAGGTHSSLRQGVLLKTDKPCR